jgi:hypothetical protein
MLEGGVGAQRRDAGVVRFLGRCRAEHAARARVGHDAKGGTAGDDGAFTAAEHQRCSAGGGQGQFPVHDDQGLGVGEARDIHFTGEADAAGAHRARAFTGDFAIRREGIGRA